MSQTTYIHVMRTTSGRFLGVKEDLSSEEITVSEYAAQAAVTQTRPQASKPRSPRTKKAPLPPPVQRFPANTPVRSLDGRTTGITTGSFTGEFTRVQTKDCETWIYTASLIEDTSPRPVNHTDGGAACS